MTRILLLVALATLAGCKQRIVKEYVPVEVVRYVYTPVDPGLTNPHPVAEGPLSACPDVARQRKRELEACNADKASIRSIQNNPVGE